MINYASFYSGVVYINDTATSVVSDGQPNPFSQDKALQFITILNGEPYHFGSQNVVKLTMSDGRVINRTPKLDDVGRYIGCAKSGDGVIETDLDLYYN